MAYDTEVEQRIDALTKSWDMQLTKKKMFGGIGYLIGGNMCFGIHKNELIIRTDEQQASELLSKKGIRVFDMTGRPMKNWFMATPEAFDSEDKLQELLEIGRNFAISLPPK